MDKNIFNQEDIISTYPLQQAVADGILVEIFKNRWQEMSGGKPIVATSHLFHEISLAGLMEIWNEYVQWVQQILPTLAEEDQLFVTTMNSEKVWVIEDDQGCTLMYPDDY